MKVDAYHSQKSPSYGLVVPAGTDLNTLSGEASQAVTSLSPLSKQKSNVDLSSIAIGDLLTHLENQIAQSGAGLMKQVVKFGEVI